MATDRQTPPDDADVDALEAPLTTDVILVCPRCAQSVTITATLSARVVLDSDGTGTLALRTKAAKAGHVCGQTTLGLVEGPRSR